MLEDEKVSCRAKALRTHGAHGANSSPTRQECAIPVWCARTLRPCICSVKRGSSTNRSAHSKSQPMSGRHVKSVGAADQSSCAVRRQFLVGAYAAVQLQR